MSSKNIRLTATVEKPLYRWLKESAQAKRMSLAARVRELLSEALEWEEDRFLFQQGEERLRTFDPRTAKTHEEVWGKK